MKRQYVFTEDEYIAIRNSVSSAYYYMAKMLSEKNFSTDDSNTYNDLRYALNIIDGHIKLKD